MESWPRGLKFEPIGPWSVFDDPLPLRSPSARLLPGEPMTTKVGLLVLASLVALAARTEERVIADEEIAVSAGQAQMRGFSVPEDLTGVRLTITVSGRKHTDKGFSVILLQGKGAWENYRSKK